MKLDEKKIAKILADSAFITADDARRAEEFAKKHQTSVVDYLLSQGLITKDLYGQAVAEHYGIPYADLNSYPPSRERVRQIPEAMARKHRVVLFKEDAKGATIATDDPELAQPFLEELKRIGKKKFALAYSLAEDIDQSFIHYRQALDTRFGKIMAGQKRIAPEIIDEIFGDAIAYRASDIHLEPQEKEVVIRFRIDGILHEAGRIPKAHYENILNRIKVQAHLRIDEHFTAQDGAIRFDSEGDMVDMRVSIAPMLDGEKVVIRLLSQYVRSFTMADLGFSPRDQQLVANATKKPFGMIVVAGPTGSGKTTTLYALLKILNQPEANITTIEDPVEYKIAGVNQIQVNPQTGLTFAKGLRSIVRQDPNIILVGEIRDRETAEIAVNAALTGHLLLSTFHANDASTVVPRLLDMGIEPFLLASTLELVIAQRLVRRICESCRISDVVDRAEILRSYPEASRHMTAKTYTLYKGKGCPTCNGSGYKGRTAIFEVISATPEMQDLILKNPAMRQIGELAKAQGARSLFEDGLEKVKSGVTTMEELLRVAKPRAS